MACAVIMGFGSLMPMTIGITIIQVESAPNMRGRVMSYVALAYFGMLPLGSLLIGAVSQRTSASVTMLCQGIMAMIITAIFWRLFKKKINPAKPE